MSVTWPFKWLASAVFAALLIACAPTISATETGDTAALSSTEQQSCVAAGGQVIHGRHGPLCAAAAEDAGAACSASSECQGLCLAQNGGTCAPYRDARGCVDVIEGGQQVTLCID